MPNFEFLIASIMKAIRIPTINDAKNVIIKISGPFGLIAFSGKIGGSITSKRNDDFIFAYSSCSEKANINSPKRFLITSSC